MLSKNIGCVTDSYYSARSDTSEQKKDNQQNETKIMQFKTAGYLWFQRHLKIEWEAGPSG